MAVTAEAIKSGAKPAADGKRNALQTINDKGCHNCHRKHTPQIAYRLWNGSAAENEEGQGTLQKGADAAVWKRAVLRLTRRAA